MTFEQWWTKQQPLGLFPVNQVGYVDSVKRMAERAWDAGSNENWYKGDTQDFPFPRG